MVGETVSHYKILDKLGGGGMGVVYRAQDLKLDRIVALKFLPPALSNDDERKERFIIEAKAASALDHANVGTIYEVDEADDGQLFIAMAYYEGATLKKKIASRPLALDEALEIAKQICSGLVKVHAEDIVHRDIKPANVIITEDGVVKIVDFGLAKLVTLTSITNSGATLGTPAYMSPEQTRGRAVDARADLWSLGVVLYEMVAGELPFKGGHAQAVVHAILNEEPVFEAVRAKSPELAAVLQRALEKDPDKRCQSAEDFLREIEALEQSSDAPSGVTEIRSSAPPEPGKRRSPLMLAGAVALIVVASLLFWRARERSRIEDALASLEPVIAAGNLDEVFVRVQELGLDLNDARLNELAASAAGVLAIETDPPGVPVEAFRAEAREDFAPGEPTTLGVTPIENARLVAGEYLLRLGQHELLLQLDVGSELHIVRDLGPNGDVPEDMVFIEAGTAAVLGGKQVEAFLIDRREVTNAQFLEFVAAGGYQNPDYWRLEAAEMMNELVDRTGIPGPRHWSGGTYPDGRGNHPVVGVSWYEADAYAKWAGKALPKWDQWWRAALGAEGEVFPWGNDVRSVDARSNFGLEATRAVGSYPLGISPYGCYDMAGNAREWLRELTDVGKSRAVGGSWLDPTYMFEPSHAEAFDPSYANDAIGFRCVKTLEE